MRKVAFEVIVDTDHYDFCGIAYVQEQSAVFKSWGDMYVVASLSGLQDALDLLRGGIRDQIQDITKEEQEALIELITPFINSMYI